MDVYTVSFNGHRSIATLAASPRDAVTAQSIQKYNHLNVDIDVTPCAPNRKIVWDIRERKTGKVLGFATVHKPKDQRALRARIDLLDFCNECGCKSEKEDIFCGNCGTKFS